ncbi:phage tail tube assembly chaperone [Pediococcus claussenii]|uniref:phage tail tube assembly chaperone n=1 Tax=Pediococcus claussenii TaxID=187452 RepID=UPI00081A6F45|nr:phage tail tube assembly chaperone [Pediococcus claussenii]ANZ70375.1 hypothetical protein AYR57_08625 [Pediococcus claussenii]ANZ72191.1 hypothetical protein AYR58_08625 [Pediococcus claussenii]
MKINLEKLGINKTKEVKVTGKVMRSVLQSNKTLLGSVKTVNEANNELENADDEGFIDPTIKIMDSQLDSIDVMESTLRTVFGLTDKEIDKFLDQDYFEVQANYQEIMSQLLNGGAPVEGEKDPKSK